MLINSLRTVCRALVSASKWKLVHWGWVWEDQGDRSEQFPVITMITYNTLCLLHHLQFTKSHSNLTDNADTSEHQLTINVKCQVKSVLTWHKNILSLASCECNKIWITPVVIILPLSISFWTYHQVFTYLLTENTFYLNKA